MAIRVSLVFALVLSCLVVTCYATISFSSLKPTLVVTASPKPGQDLIAGKDNITVSWSLNTTYPAGTDSAYKMVKLKLCYAQISQLERRWRRTEDNLMKDKTCQHKIVARPYTRSNNNVTWTVQRDVPTATYFIRAYVYDSNDHEVAFGQTTDTNKKTNLFNVEGFSGRHLSLDIASVCFSAFSVLSLFGFFYMEKRKAKTLQNK